MTRKRQSLRRTLLFWFILTSVIPLSFITGYSLVRYEQAISEELYKRLEGNAREFSVVLNDLEKNYLMTYGRQHADDPGFVRRMSSGSFGSARKSVEGWLQNYVAGRVSVFDKKGRRLFAFEPSEKGPREIPQDPNQDIFISQSLVDQVSSEGQVAIRDVRPGAGLEIAVYTRIESTDRRRVAGILEEILVLDEAFLTEQKKRLKLELFLLDGDGKLVAASNQDIPLLPEGFLSSKVDPSGFGSFDLKLREDPFGFIVRPIKMDSGKFFVGVGSSKQQITQFTRKISIAMVAAAVVVVLLLIPILWWSTNYIVRPIEALVEGARKISEGGDAKKIPVDRESEIGDLIDSFNKMSSNVSSARKELEGKVKELEEANKELQTTQSRLVHSAKMVSLGQLVAGVAHELNNPIGFIYSNMAHLKDYSEKLFDLLAISEEDPDSLELQKAEMDFEYIKKDMPKLIKSCEEGALRTRDIVLGLRNFSRLDEATIKEVDVNEGLVSTLKLLAGEIKARIKVETDLQKVPLVRCYASQLNQVFMNILSNAVQAIPEEGTVWVKSWSEGDKVFISIKDSGPGISAENLDKIFDPFFTTKGVGKGTGLGLSITYGIIKKHGGDIHVSSKKGEGTEFRIEIPVDGLSHANA